MITVEDFAAALTRAGAELVVLFSGRRWYARVEMGEAIEVYSADDLIDALLDAHMAVVARAA